MTKIYYDFDKINSQILPIISKAKNYSSKACTTINSIDIPADFKYLNYLKNVKNDIISLDKDIENIKEWLENSQKKYKKISLNMDTLVSKLTISEIEKRNKLLN